METLPKQTRRDPGWASEDSDLQLKLFFLHSTSTEFVEEIPGFPPVSTGSKDEAAAGAKRPDASKPALWAVL